MVILETIPSQPVFRVRSRADDKTSRFIAKPTRSVGPPINLLCYERDRLQADVRQSIDHADPYFNEIKRQWAEDLREVFARLPAPCREEKLDPI